MGSIRLVPGRSITGDANETHPKGDILNVKAFYEQDSHIIPDELKEVHVSITEGIDNVWWEYAPADLREDEQPPLIISFHGGGQNGYGQCYATGWVLLADKYRFVTVFPSASVKRAWTRDPEGPDFKLVDEIIRQMKERYHIDEGRIYIQGMSSGNMMTTALSKNKPELFAGAGMSAGPDSVEAAADPDIDLSGKTAIPVFQSRGERDRLAPKLADSKGRINNRYDLNKYDRRYWLKVNGCREFPAVIKIEGRNNYFVYRGEKADLYYRDVKYRGHGQTVDDAEKMWRYYFSGTRRNPDGSLTFTEPLEKLTGDHAFIVADGCRSFFLDGVKKDLTAACYEVTDVMVVPERLQAVIPDEKITYGPFMYVPLSFFEQAFGFSCESTYEGHGAVLRSADGSCVIEVSEGNVGCVINDVLYNMERQAEYKDGQLFVPVRDFAERFGYTVIAQDGVVYITDHAGEMTSDFAGFLKEYLSE